MWLTTGTMKAGKPSLHFTKATVSSNIEIAPGVFLLSFPRRFTFKAGQVLGLQMEGDETHRLYSIASGEDDDEVVILFDINPEGFLTPRLAKLQAGDTLLHTQPFGFFHDEDGPAYWIATGTGIAPFRSMFRSGKQVSKTLIHGARSLPLFFFSEEFAPVFQDNYLRCSSREPAEGVFHGRITQLLGEDYPLDCEARYLLCGSAEMVVDVRDLLISKGIPFENIRAEIYF